MKYSMIKAVFIDIDNTLLDFNKCAKLAMRQSFNECNLVFTDEVFPTFKRINDELWKKIELKTLTRKGLHDIRWNLILSELKIDFDGKTLEKRFLENLNYSVVPVDGAEEILAYLSSKYEVYTVSNAPMEQQKKRLKSSGFDRYIKKAFISQEIGFDKPDKRFFEACFLVVNHLKREEVVLIGDSISADIVGGRNYGLKTIWFNFENQQDIDIADYTVKSLMEIKNIL